MTDITGSTVTIDVQEMLKALRQRAAVEWRAGTESNELHDLLRVAANTLETADRAADERWCAALKLADWDGGVFHYEGRIYPWPKGFVPDCPATWDEKLRPLRVELDSANHTIAGFIAMRDRIFQQADGRQLFDGPESSEDIVGRLLDEVTKTKALLASAMKVIEYFRPLTTAVRAFLAYPVRAHECPGFDCATCAPRGELDRAFEGIADMVDAADAEAGASVSAAKGK